MQLRCFPIYLVSAIYWVSTQSQARVGFWNVTVTKEQVQGKCTRHLCCALRVTELGVCEAWWAPHPGNPATRGTTPWTGSPSSPPAQAPPQWGTGKTWEECSLYPTAWNLLVGFFENVPWAYYRERQLLKDIRVRELILSNVKPSPLRSYFRD